MNMIPIRRPDVPQYLQSSPLFENAFHYSDDENNCEDGLAVEIPADCLKLTPDVQNESDLRALLLTIRYWLIPEYIETNADVFIFVSNDKDSFNQIASEFGEDFPFLTKLSSALQPPSNLTVMGRAMQLGLLSFVKYLRANGSAWDSGTALSITSLAAGGGQLDCLQYAIENGCKASYETCSTAAKAGHVNCLKYAHERGGRFNMKVFEIAVINGHLACVKCIVESKALDDRVAERFCEVAARAGNIEVLTYLLSAGYEATLAAANGAAAFDHLECLKHLHHIGCPVNSKTSHIAVQCGSMQCVLYLHTIGCSWDPTTLQVDRSTRIAVARGRYGDSFYVHELVATFMYAAENGCPITPGSMFLAAALGSTEFVAYLHGREVPLDASAYRIAITKNNGPCIDYFLQHNYTASLEDYLIAVEHACLQSVRSLHEHGVAWDESVTSAAVLHAKPEILCYLLDHGCAVAGDTLLRAAQLPKVACLQCLHEHGVPLHKSVVTNAVAATADQCLQYALSQGCPISEYACVLAATNGNLDFLTCLHEHGAPMTLAIVNAAVENGHFKCVAFAVAHGCEDLGHEVCVAAAKLRSFGPLQCLREVGVHWEFSTYTSAIHSNSFECLKYAVKHGCPGDHTLLLPEAALHGRRDMLKWLHKKGIAWDARTTAAAVQSDSVECLMYAIQRHCPYDVSAEILEKSPRCREYMDKRGNSIVQRARRRIQTDGTTMPDLCSA